MKSNKNALKNLILFYLIAFSIMILLFLYLFQIVFLNLSYKMDRNEALNHAITNLKEDYNTEDYNEIDSIAQEYDVCIDLIVDNTIVYSTSIYNDKCMSKNNNILNKFEIAFIKNGVDKKTVEILNPAYNNKTLVTGQKLDDKTYAFINTSLVPLDNSIKILKSQFLYVGLIIILISFLVSYFISRRIARPITKLNKAAKRLGEKDYSVVYPTDDNILEISELATTLNNTTKELAKTDQLRRELMANVSHDLKTPLTMIKAYAEAARDLNSKNITKRTENLNIIIDEVERLNILVNDILELSKMESKVADLNIEEFDLTALINSIIRRFDILVKDGYTFIFEEKGEKLVKADEKRIGQVVYNLINNAINYTGKDKTVTIRIEDKKNTYLVEVIDTGPGIAKEDIDMIWEKYYRIDKHYKRNKMGTGLGLSIVKQILKNHNFTYGVKSKKNKGSTFYFEITKADKKENKNKKEK